MITCELRESEKRLCGAPAVVIVDVNKPCGHRFVRKPLCQHHWNNAKKNGYTFACTEKNIFGGYCNISYVVMDHLTDFEFIKENE